jgi:hypothetical protein
VTRIPVGTQVVVTGKGLRGKKRKGTIVAPELVKGYNVRHHDDGTVTRYPGKKVRVAATREQTKVRPISPLIEELLEPDRQEAKRFREAAVAALEGISQPVAEDKPASAFPTFTGPLRVGHIIVRDGEYLAIRDKLTLDIVNESEQWRNRAQPKPPAPRRSKSYLAFVRKLDCCNCGTPGPSDPHHEGKRGVGQKTSDMLVVPLCRRCHSIYTDENQLPRCVDGKDRGRFDREGSLTIMHGAQANLLTMVLERLAPGKRAEVLAAAVASLDDETLTRVLK